jgi:hypothetical protein
VQRTIAVGVAILGVLTLALASASPAAARTFAQIRFRSDHVTLTVPTPSCRPTHGTTSCQWTLAVTGNVHGPVIGRATGTAGSLSVPYPANYCGVIHAAAIVGPPWRKEVGHKHTIGNCATPGTISPASVSAVVVAHQSTANGSQIESQTSGPSVLPFTGAPILDMLIVGIGCLVLAAYCLRRRPPEWTGSATELLQVCDRLAVTSDSLQRAVKSPESSIEFGSPTRSVASLGSTCSGSNS